MQVVLACLRCCVDVAVRTFVCMNLYVCRRGRPEAKRGLQPHLGLYDLRQTERMFEAGGGDVALQLIAFAASLGIVFFEWLSLGSGAAMTPEAAWKATLRATCEVTCCVPISFSWLLTMLAQLAESQL